MRRERSRPRNEHARPPIKNIARLTVDGLAWGGKGVGRHEGKVIFVSKAVPGDRVAVEVDRDKSSYAEGRIGALLAPGPDRVDPRCPFFARCGGCQWLAVSYSRQLKEKEALLRSILRHHMEGVMVEPIAPSDPSIGYRHRGDFHAEPKGSELGIGFFEEESHRVVDLDDCLLFSRRFNSLYRDIRTAFRDQAFARALSGFTLAADDEDRHFSIHLRTRGDSGAEAEELAETVMQLGLHGAVVTPNTETGRVLVSKGSPRITFRLASGGEGRGELVLRADVRSFTQAHFAMNQQMVESAGDWLCLSQNDRLLDLYSGIGNFTLPLAAVCREVTAVESSPFASEDAKGNAQLNGIMNVRHLSGDAGDWVGRLAAASERFEAVLLDPPRAGARGVIEPLALLGARRILYVSCNLPSLERDLELFQRFGYRPVRIQPWDLFPHTYGVETFCLLARPAGS